ncbi:MAG: nucleoside monophosphate kinase [Candidatus Calescibacterium sp.]|nr:nucleoside monophosphate kinase [Candidatus Calescibacterium sp.]MDW8132500.1 nucleoside monophosphate kinase [Candidatus Calescibacterium sp.]
MKLYLFFGPPGSGKGTQANLIKQKFPKTLYLSTGDYMRYHIKNQTEIGKMAQNYINQGMLVPSSLINKLVLEEINKMKTNNPSQIVILDGYPRTIEQLQFLIQNISKPYLTIFFDISLEKIIERICLRRICPKCNSIYHLIYQKPQNNERCDFCNIPLIQREDDNEEIVKKRYEIYKAETLPVIKEIENQNLQIVFVNSSQEITKIFEQILPYFETNSQE